MRKAITIALIMIVAICTACNKKQVNKQNEKLFYAIEEENYQAVKECLEDKNLDLEHLKLSDRTQFAKKDQRALGLAMEQLFGAGHAGTDGLPQRRPAGRQHPARRRGTHHRRHRGSADTRAAARCRRRRLIRACR